MPVNVRSQSGGVLVAFVLVVGLLIGAASDPSAAHASTGSQWEVVAPRLESPTAIAVDAVGNVYALEAGVHSVIKLSPSGQLSLLGSGITTPDALFVAANGDVYVSDDASGTIDEITPAGTQTTVTSAPSAPEPIPQLAVSSTTGEIWFTQLTAGIYESAPGGTPTAISAPGGGVNSALTADNLGNVYVQAGHDLDEYAPDGTLTQIPDPPRFASNAEWGPIHSDATGRIWADDGTPPTGYGLNYTAGISSIIYPLPSGAVWNVTPGGDVVEAGTSFVDFIDTALSTTYLPMDDLGGGLGLVAGPDGNVQVGQGECQVEVDAGGTEHPDPADFPDANYGCDASHPLFAGTVAGGGATTADPYARDFFTIDERSSDEQVAELTEEPDGVASLNDVAGSNPLQASLGPEIASNGTDSAWFMSSLAGGTLYKVDYPSGTLTSLGPLTNVNALAVDAAGNVYAAQQWDVEEVPAAGGAPTVVVSSLGDAEGVAIDASGNLWIADAGNNQVLEDVGGTTSPVGDDLDGPMAIAFGADGSVYALGTLGVEELVHPGVPTPARDVTVVPGDRQLAVSWQPPADLGTGALTTYTVRVYSRAIGIDATCTTDTTSCVVTNAETARNWSYESSGLNDAESVDVEVLTTTTAGRSETAPVSAAPVQSSDSVLAAPAEDGASAEWYSPYSAQAPTSYVITPYLETSKGFVTQHASTFADGSIPSPARVGNDVLLGPVTVQGLLAGHTYVLSVRAVVDAESGPSSKTSGWVEPESKAPSGRAPSAPPHLKVTYHASTHSYVATWAHPSSAGTSTVQYYCVQPIATTGSDANAICVKASSQTATINRYARGRYTGFAPGTYNVAIYAVNRTLTGELSPTVKVTIANGR